MFRIIPFVMLLLFTSTASYAGESAHGSQLADMIYRTLNFAVMVSVLYFVLSKPLKSYIASRSDSIRKALDEAKNVREEAEKKYREYQGRMEQLASEAKELRDSLTAEGIFEKERIIKEADKAARRIAEQTRFTAEQEIRKARLALKEETANLIAGMAEDRLKKEMKDSDQDKLVREYISASGGVH